MVAFSIKFIRACLLTTRIILNQSTVPSTFTVPNESQNTVLITATNLLPLSYPIMSYNNSSSHRTQNISAPQRQRRPSHVARPTRREYPDLTCQFCNKTFTRPQSTVRHIKKVHGLDPADQPSASAKCVDCGLEFQSTLDRESHICFCHTSLLGPNVCMVCHQMYEDHDWALHAHEDLTQTDFCQFADLR